MTTHQERLFSICWESKALRVPNHSHHTTGRFAHSLHQMADSQCSGRGNRPHSGSTGSGIWARTCRFLCGMETRATPPSVPAVTPTTKTNARKVKLSQVINQADEDEVDILDQAVITAAYAAYRNKFPAGSPTPIWLYGDLSNTDCRRRSR